MTNRLPRLFWCPFGLSSCIPLHAGIISSMHRSPRSLSETYMNEANEGPHVTFVPDFVVSSYTPSLQTLVRARQTTSWLPIQDVRLCLYAHASGVQPSFVQRHWTSSEVQSIAHHVRQGIARKHATVQRLLQPEVPGIAIDSTSGKVLSLDSESSSEDDSGDEKSDDHNLTDATETETINSAIQVLDADNTTHGKILDLFSSANMLHITCAAAQGIHGGKWRPQPLGDALYLANNQTLTIQDLLQVDLSNLRFTFLSLYSSSQSRYASVRGDYLGFAACLLQMGLGGVVATMWCVL